MPTSPCLRLRPEDSVGVATRRLPAGSEIGVDGSVIRLLEDIPSGHKVALVAVPPGEQVRKYGQVIGLASKQIRPGEHVHTHNLAFARVARDYEFGADLRESPAASAHTRGDFPRHNPPRRPGCD